MSTARALHGLDKVGRCAKCGARVSSVCGAMNDDELRLMSSVTVTRTLAKDDTLFQEGDKADRVFVIKSGGLRLTRVLADGRRSILGFALTGDFVGQARHGVYSHSAEALGDADVCAIPKARFDALRTELPHLMTRFCDIMQDSLTAAQNHLVSLGQQSVEERLASAVLDLEARSGVCGFDGDLINLPMARTDLADYLGVTLESVSRCFSQWERRNLIALESPRRLRLMNHVQLRALASGADDIDL